jgi:hypothetical protein
MTLEGETFERNADERGRISLPTSKAKNRRFKIKVVEEVKLSEEVNMDELDNWEAAEPGHQSGIFSAHYTEDDRTYLFVSGSDEDESFFIHVGVKDESEEVTGVKEFEMGEYDTAEEAVKEAKSWMKKNDKNLSVEAES